MISLIITVIVMIGIVAHFYLRFTPMKSFVALMAAIIGFVTAFSYYEVAANLLISRGYIPQLAQSLCFILIFILTSVIIEVLSGFIVGANIDFGQPVKIVTAIVCGLITAIIVSGAIAIAFALAPLSKSNPYARFDETFKVRKPSKVMIPADDFIAGFYNLIAKGALGSENRFDVLHANFLNQVHLNRYAVKEGAAMVAAKDAAFVERFGVREKELPGGDVRTVIELNIKAKSIKEGGAMDSGNTLSFALAQTRLICGTDGQSELTGGNIEILYPEKYLIKGKPVKKDIQPSEVISFDRDSYITTSKGKAARVDLAFMVPKNLTPMFLEFKANNIISLPKMATQADIDAAAEEEANKPEEVN